MTRGASLRQSSAAIAARFIARRERRVPRIDPVVQALQVEAARSQLDRDRRRGFVEGWNSIGVLAGRSERWCRYMAVTAIDPLPAFRVGGIYRLNVADFEAWVERRHAAAIARTTIPAIAPAIEEHW